VSSRKTPELVYRYKRLNATVAFEKIRYRLAIEDEETGEVSVDKTFGYRYQTPEQKASGSDAWWTWDKPPWADKYPFLLPELFDAVLEGQDVLIAEGEKDALAARDAWDIATTTHHQGSAGWSPRQASWIAAADRLRERSSEGGTVAICHDPDVAGHLIAWRTREALIACGFSARRILHVEPVGGDLHDHIQAGGTERTLVVIGAQEMKERADASGQIVASAGGFSKGFGSAPWQKMSAGGWLPDSWNDTYWAFRAKGGTDDGQRVGPAAVQALGPASGTRVGRRRGGTGD
jgi:hypothetical protein